MDFFKKAYTLFKNQFKQVVTNENTKLDENIEEEEEFLV